MNLIKLLYKLWEKEIFWTNFERCLTAVFMKTIIIDGKEK